MKTFKVLFGCLFVGILTIELVDFLYAHSNQRMPRPDPTLVYCTTEGVRQQNLYNRHNITDRLAPGCDHILHYEEGPYPINPWLVALPDQ